MKIIRERTTSVVHHMRTVLLEDGPVIGAGDSYHEGTFFQVNKIRIKWIDDTPAATVSLFGPRTNADGTPYLFKGEPDSFEHQLNLPTNKGLPEWLVDFITENNLYVELTDGQHRR
jgi:hypothetical protein